MSRSIVVLSDKSSGSTLLQRLLTGHPDVHVVPVTPHQENETLYWAKAAAALGLPQQPIMGSTAVPMSPGRGARTLLELLNANDSCPWTGPVDQELVFDGWERLSRRYGPVFLEKSPHHLHSWSAIELMLRLRDERGADLRFVGLVRDPMDTLYSMWRRWGVVPERRQHDWVRAYSNLLRLAGVVGPDLLLLRYEDLVSRADAGAHVCARLGLRSTPMPLADVHQGSVGRWRPDRGFGFRPGPALVALGGEMGYDLSHLPPPTAARSWAVRREARGLVRTARRRRAARLQDRR